MKGSIFIASGLIVGVVAVAPVVTNGISYAETTTNHQQLKIEAPINTVVRGSVGERKVVATKAVPNGEYIVKVVAHNQHSVHPGSNVHVSSTGDTVVVEDVESKAFKEGVADGTLVVADGKITVEIELGKDKVFSGGISVILEAKSQPPAEEPEVPVTPEEPKGEGEVDAPEVPAELPKTGFASILAPALGLGSLVYTAQLYLSSRRK